MSFDGRATREDSTTIACVGTYSMRASGDKYTRNVFLLIFLIFNTVGRLQLVLDDASASAVSQVLWGSCYLIAFVGLNAHRKQAMTLLRASAPLIGLLFIAALSSAWSEDPVKTLERSIGLIGSVTIALFFVCRLDLKGFVKAFLFAVSAFSIISVPLIIAFPDLGRMQDDGSWTGLFAHKNVLGTYMVLGLISLATLAGRARGDYRIGLACLAALFVVLLGGSRSATNSAIALGLSVSFALLLVVRRRRSMRPLIVAALLLSTLVGGAYAVGVDSDDVFAIWNKNSTLTGRTELWQAAALAISERPLFGYGYREFWVPDGEAARFRERADVDSWTPPTGHDGYLDCALDFGIFGELALLSFLGLGLIRACTQSWRGNDLLCTWPLLVLSYTIINNLSETTLLGYHDHVWIVTVAAFFFAKLPGPAQPTDNSESSYELRYRKTKLDAA